MIDVLLNLDARRPQITIYKDQVEVFSNYDTTRFSNSVEYLIVGKREKTSELQRREGKRPRLKGVIRRAIGCNLNQRKALKLKSLLDLIARGKFVPASTNRYSQSNDERFFGTFKYHIKDEDLEQIKEFIA